MNRRRYALRVANQRIEKAKANVRGKIMGKQRDSRTIGSKPSGKTPIADKVRREVQHPYGKGNTHPTKKVDNVDPI